MSNEKQEEEGKEDENVLSRLVQWSSKLWG